MKTAICDDDVSLGSKIERLVDQAFDGNASAYSCEVFLSADALLAYLAKNPLAFQIYLLDIEMAGARPTEQQDSLKFILLPSYLLVRNLKLVAIPTKNITGVSFKFERRKSDAVTYAHYQISTRETTHRFDVNFAEEAYSQKLVDALGAFFKSINQGDQGHAL